MDWAKSVVALFGGCNNMLNVHLVGAVVMIFAGLYHIVWLVLHFTFTGPQWSMVPTKQDALNAFHHAKYLLGITKEPPKHDRYTYLEKFEYLAGGYGIILMGLTGFFLWFPEIAAAVMPRWVIHLLRIAHSNEAVVCLIAVSIGHFFWVHFHPDVFPTSKVWINGKISRHHEMEEHPLEYERLVTQYGGEENVEEEHPSNNISKRRWYMGLMLAIYILVIGWIFVQLVPKLLT
ncbi:MAG: cytochrome b/b6 domain-containing protein [Clostridia bacterium]|nr:cytochrome b/b6 domain-containing protein [Clostridia bacterium]